MNQKLSLSLILILFVAHQLLQKGLGIHIPFVDSFLDPMLGMALLLFGWQKEQELVFQKESLGYLDVIVLTLFASLFFEFLLPKWHSGFTKDPLDLIFYAFGALLFLLLLNRPANHLISKANS